MTKDSVIDVVHKTIYDFLDVVEDDSEEPIKEKDKLLLEVNKAICNAIREMPNGRKTGKWVTDGCIDICSECGASRENQLWDKYCGRCGAKMEGIEDNNDNSIAILKAMQESADAVRNSPQYDFSCVTSLFDEEGAE